MTTILFENQLNCCDVIDVDDDADDDNKRTCLVKRNCKREMWSGSIYVALAEETTFYPSAKCTVFHHINFLCNTNFNVSPCIFQFNN